MRSPKGKDKAATSADDELESVQVGMRVRHARILRGMRMRDLAEKVGCDESMISKIEAGKVIPSLATLNKIVRAVDRDLGSFFGLEIDAHKLVQRPGDRLIVEGDALRDSHGIRYERLVPLAAGNLLEANIHLVDPNGAKTDHITHQGETVGYLLEGEIELSIDGTVYKMSVGDSFFMKAYLPCSYRNTGTSVARIIWVNTPQVH